MLSGFLLMPVLSRLFDNEAFGTFGLLNNMMLTASGIIGFKLSEAFILRMDEDEFHKLARVAMTSIILGVLLLLAICLIFRESLFNFFGLDVPFWVVVVSPIICGVYAFREYQGNHIRKLESYKKISFISSSADVAGRLISVGIGVAVSTAFWGLWIKEVFKALLIILTSSRLIFSGRLLPTSPILASITETKYIFRKYYQFPAYQMPSVLAAMLAAGLPLYLIGRQFNVGSLGDFTMVLTLLSFPTNLLSRSIASVFQQRAAKWYKKEPDKLSESIELLCYSLTALGAIIFGLVYWSGPILFKTFLGDNWGNAGIYASIMSPLFLVRMLSPPIVSLRTVTNEQNWNLIFNLLAVAGSAFSFWFGNLHDYTLSQVLILFTLINTVLLVLSMGLVLVKSGVNLLKTLIVLLFIVLLCSGITYLPSLLIG